MNILIGSRALQYYNRLNHREPSDYDFISDTHQGKKIINNSRVEYYNTNESESTKKIYNYCLAKELPKTIIFDQEIAIAPLEILKVLKLSSTPVE